MSAFLIADTDTIDEGQSSYNYEVSSTSNNVPILDETVENNNRIASAEQFLTVGYSYQADADYDKAIECYLTGLGVSMFYIGDTETAIELIRKAQSFSDRETETGNNNKFYFFNYFVHTF